MDFLQFALSLIIPILTPFLLLVFSLPNEGDSVEVDEKGIVKVNSKKNVFIAELPMALIANTIWGMSFKYSGLTEKCIQSWIVYYVIILIIQISFSILSKKAINKALFYSSVFVMLIVVICMTFVRTNYPILFN
jgi:hypothetical protein